MKFKVNKLSSMLTAGFLAVLALTAPSVSSADVLDFKKITRQIEQIKSVVLQDADDAVSDTRTMIEEIKIDGRMFRARADRLVVREKGSSTFRVVNVSAGISLRDAISNFQKNKNLVYVEPDFEVTAFTAPNDPYYTYQWNLFDVSRGGVGAEGAWEYGDGNGVVVAMLDTGIAYETRGKFYMAPDFTSDQFVAGYDFIENDTHPNDDNGHGTHTASIVAEVSDNAIGISGLAPGVRLMPVKVLGRNGSGSYSAVASGIRWAADHGAKVINLSLGGTSPATYLEEALQYAYNKGVTIVAAAGNNGASSLSYPAAYNDYVIAVGATGSDKNLAYYSNFGEGLDIVAPGGDTRVDKNGDGYADGVLGQSFTRPNYANIGYYFMQGTSMAAPHVSGAAALVSGAMPSYSNSMIREVLQDNALDLGDAGYDNLYGYGLLQAGEAVKKARDSAVTPPVLENVLEVSVISPSEGEKVTGNVWIKATTTNGNPIVRADYLADDQIFTVSSSSPFEAIWDSTVVADGPHKIGVIVTDSSGQSAKAEVNIIVNNVKDVFFSDDFDGGNLTLNWVNDAAGAWVLSQKEKISPEYSIGVTGRVRNAAVRSKQIAVGGNSTRIEFSWRIDSMFSSRDYLAFDVSTDGGKSFSQKAVFSGGSSAKGAWKTESVSISVAQNLVLRFRGNIARRYSGYIDDVRVIEN
ncbi:MAG: hypothetical protein A3G59_03390 [Candidatus Taylorbacteria bacterium RIFCSPLOWO2_12_FULL_47_20]|uniref:Peptidase S8/S53 domain-containing protein n=2 Tax=Candidatus Tayloriibacteriota TaxID=1817919 RepID=A0A1G2PBB8_9BACT|nr:MAG: hypothetical protein A3H68_02245 [Candidatus Taylorbacteria bacterium RIFCSPLOWO2_02_FULL_46_40]OHA45635.1 MAG: hypothetical protein A3G59_03390 [Candidatus Taylorbacteria bacterium RIFCSPLOWO2_12_FULL_47_20]